MRNAKKRNKGLIPRMWDLDKELTGQRIARRLAQLEREVTRLKRASGRLYGKVVELQDS